MGKLARSNRISIGRSASSGSSAITRSRRSRMSFAATSRSVPHEKATLTMLCPSEDDDVISSTPCTAASASSMGRVIDSSIS